MTVFFSAAAETQMEEAYDYLEKQREGLGDNFAMDVTAGVHQIAGHPLRWPEIEPGFRRYRTHKFKYSLIYRIRNNQAEIVSVWHWARRPGAWRSTLT